LARVKKPFSLLFRTINTENENFFPPRQEEGVKVNFNRLQKSSFLLSVFVVVLWPQESYIKFSRGYIRYEWVGGRKVLGSIRSFLPEKSTAADNYFAFYLLPFPPLSFIFMHTISKNFKRPSKSFSHILTFNLIIVHG
jgi:hypothetical protein